MKRELAEETGYSAENLSLIGEFNPSVGYTDETLYIYMATYLTKGETNFDDDEDLELMEIPLQEAVNLVVKGEITDGKTMAGILLATHHI